MELKYSPLLDIINPLHNTDYIELKSKLNKVKDLPKKHSTEIIDYQPLENKLRFKLSDLEHIIGECCLKIILPKLKENQRWKKNIGDRIVKNIEFTVGGRNLESLDTDFHYLSKWLNRDEESDKIYNKLTGNIPELYEDWGPKDNYTIYLPINLYLTSYSYIFNLPSGFCEYDIIIELNDINDLIETKNNILNQINSLEIKLIKKIYFLKEEDQNEFYNGDWVQLVQHQRFLQTKLEAEINLNFIRLECKYLYFYILPKNKTIFDVEPIDLIDYVELCFDKYLRLKTYSDELRIFNFYQLFKRIPNNIYLINFIEDLNDFTTFDCSNFNKFENVILKLKFKQDKIKKLIYHKNNYVLHGLNKIFCNELVKNIFDFIKFDDDYVINQFDIKIQSCINNFLRAKGAMAGVLYTI